MTLTPVAEDAVRRRTPVVGVGASAGGLDAYQRLLELLPGTTGAAFVLVQQHLEPHHATSLPEILSLWTRMPVLPIHDDMPVEADRVYVVPPGNVPALRDGRLRLCPATEPHPATIDAFFHSLASEDGEAATAILLSGGGTDGTAGLAAVHAHGGVTLVQAPEDAAVASMPASAIAAGAAKQVLPVAQMPDEVVRRVAELVQRDPQSLRRGRALSTFADSEVLRILAGRVLPRIIAAKSNTDTLRIWVPGCGTGEATYALAALALDQVARARRDLAVKILATDVDTAALQAAREGALSPAFAPWMQPDQRARYVVDEGDHLSPRTNVRGACLFAIHDVTREAPFSRMDVVYWTRTLRTRAGRALSNELVPVFHYALSPGGVLVSPTVEAASAHEDLFRPLSVDAPIFERAAMVTRPAFALPIDAPETSRPPPGLARATQALLLEELTPPSVVIDANGTVVCFAGRISAYLDLPVGAPSLDLMDLVRPRLRPTLHVMLAEALGGRRTTTATIEARAGAETSSRVNVTIRPLETPGAALPLFLVTFEETASAGPKTVVAPDALAVDLERELRLTRRELERALDEARMANEELRSINEELQAANAELAAFSEEQDAVNEELARRVEQSDTAHTDLQNLFAATPSAILFVDRHWKITRFTPAAKELFHLIPGDVGRPVEDIRWLAAEPDLLTRIQEVLAGERARDEDVHAFEGDRWFSRTIQPYRAHEGEVTGVVVAYADVTRLKRAERAMERSERMYRALTNLMPPIVWICDGEGRVTYVNDRFLEHTNCTLEEAKRMVWRDWLHPDDQERATRAFQAATVEHRQFEVELRGRGGDGQYRWYLVRADPELDRQGRVSAWFGVSTDIDGRKAAECALVEADRRKNDFLAMLAHELRNPLTPIRNAAHLLSRAAAADPSVKRPAEMVERQAFHMGRMLDDLLDVSRITQQKLTLKNECVDLVKLAGEIAGDQKAAFDAKNQTLRVELPSRPITTIGDATRLSQVVGNLLHNACKFTDTGGRIALRLGRSPEPPARATLVVEDDGIGIDEDVLPRIFDAFTQADRSLDRSLGGLGLGLSLVKGIVELHGGSVSAETEGLGRGSRFVVTLPVEPEQASDAQPADAEDELASARRRVLIVEDNEDAAESMQLLLQIEGHEAAIARTGREAVSVACEERPDIVLCDVGLPGGMDGYAVAGAMREDPRLKGVFLVALTGYGTAEDQQRAREAGFDVHLTKPISPERLQQVIASLPRRKHRGA
jgi:two-component system CheB/CheR fusion protein